MSTAKFNIGDKVRVFDQWPGEIKGCWAPGVYLCAYEKHGCMLIGPVPVSRIQPRKEKRK